MLLSYAEYLPVLWYWQGKDMTGSACRVSIIEESYGAFISHGNEWSVGTGNGLALFFLCRPLHAGRDDAGLSLVHHWHSAAVKSGSAGDERKSSGWQRDDRKKGRFHRARSQRGRNGSGDTGSDGGSGDDWSGTRNWRDRDGSF